jgi:hypothetical protein
VIFLRTTSKKHRAVAADGDTERPGGIPSPKGASRTCLALAKSMIVDLFVSRANLGP